MKLSEKTLAILDNFSLINPSIKIEAGNVLETRSESGTVQTYAETDQDFPREFSIFDLRSFLAIVQMMDDPEIDFQETRAVIRSKNATTTFGYCKPDMIVTVPKRYSTLDNAVEFDLTAADINKVSKATGHLNSPEIAFLSGDGTVSACAVDSSIANSNMYAMEVGQSDKEFEVYIKTENLKLMSGDYKIQVIDRASRFEGPDVTYWIANETNSRFI